LNNIKRTMDKKNTILGVLTGLAVGAVLGVLFAPAKGSETRRKIADKGNEFAELLKTKFDGIVDGMTDKPKTGEDGRS